MPRPLLHHPRLAPALILLGSVAALAVAFAAQHLGGLVPCALCIYQRYPYGVAIALALVALLLPARSGPQRGALALSGVALLVSAGIGLFHVGVEQHWWQGSAACGGALDAGLSLEQLREQILAAPVVRCDEVPWSLFGISMAGYNVLYAAGLGLLGIWLAARPGRGEARRMQEA